MYIQKRYQLNSFICYSLTIIIYNIYKNELIWKKKYLLDYQNSRQFNTQINIIPTVGSVLLAAHLFIPILVKIFILNPCMGHYCPNTALISHKYGNFSFSSKHHKLLVARSFVRDLYLTLL